MTRDEAITELTVHLEHWEHLKEEMLLPCKECENTINALDMAISALSEDIVMCKDCRHRYEEGDCTHYYWCRLNDRPIDDTDFCSWAERKKR